VIYGLSNSSIFDDLVDLQGHLLQAVSNAIIHTVKRKHRMVPCTAVHHLSTATAN